MSDNDDHSVPKKKRTFREKLTEDTEEDKKSISRSPSPNLPSRLDKIPSPSYGRKSATPEPTKDLKSKTESKEVVKKRKKSARSKSPSSRRSRSGSPRRKRSRSRDRRRSRSRERNKRRSRSRSRDKRRRSRSRDRNRRRSKRSRSRERRRSRSRSRDRRRPSPKRKIKSKSRSKTPPRFSSKGGVCRAVLSDKFKPKEVSTEEVEERLKQHMITVQEKAAEEAKKINLPGYLNPAMVNVHQFKQVQDKRKLLWSKPKDKKEGAALWSGAFDDQQNDQKFKRLMGIQGVKVDEESGSNVQASRRVLDDLEKEYEKSRAFQMSRGAGGLTGMGLGFGHMTQPQ